MDGWIAGENPPPRVGTFQENLESMMIGALSLCFDVRAVCATDDVTLFFSFFEKVAASLLLLSAAWALPVINDDGGDGDLTEPQPQFDDFSPPLARSFAHASSNRKNKRPNDIITVPPVLVTNWGLAVVDGAMIKQVLDEEENDIGITFDELSLLQLEFGKRTNPPASKRKGVTAGIFNSPEEVSKTKASKAKNKAKLVVDFDPDDEGIRQPTFIRKIADAAVNGTGVINSLDSGATTTTTTTAEPFTWPSTLPPTTTTTEEPRTTTPFTFPPFSTSTTAPAWTWPAPVSFSPTHPPTTLPPVTTAAWEAQPPSTLPPSTVSPFFGTLLGVTNPAPIDFARSSPAPIAFIPLPTLEPIFSVTDVPSTTEPEPEDEVDDPETISEATIVQSFESFKSVAQAALRPPATTSDPVQSVRAELAASTHLPPVVPATVTEALWVPPTTTAEPTTSTEAVRNAEPPQPISFTIVTPERTTVTITKTPPPSADANPLPVPVVGPSPGSRGRGFVPFQRIKPVRKNIFNTVTEPTTTTFAPAAENVVTSTEAAAAVSSSPRSGSGRRIGDIPRAETTPADVAAVIDEIDSSTEPAKRKKSGRRKPTTTTTTEKAADAEAAEVNRLAPPSSPPLEEEKPSTEMPISISKLVDNGINSLFVGKRRNTTITAQFFENADSLVEEQEKIVIEEVLPADEDSEAFRSTTTTIRPDPAEQATEQEPEVVTEDGLFGGKTNGFSSSTAGSIPQSAPGVSEETTAAPFVPTSTSSAAEESSTSTDDPEVNLALDGLFGGRSRATITSVVDESTTSSSTTTTERPEGTTASGLVNLISKRPGGRKKTTTAGTTAAEEQVTEEIRDVSSTTEASGSPATASNGLASIFGGRRPGSGRTTTTESSTITTSGPPVIIGGRRKGTGRPKTTTTSTTESIQVAAVDSEGSNGTTVSGLASLFGGRRPGSARPTTSSVPSTDGTSSAATEASADSDQVSVTEATAVTGTTNGLAGLLARRPSARPSTTTTTATGEPVVIQERIQPEGTGNENSTATSGVAGLFGKRPGQGRTTTTTTSRPESDDQTSEGSTENSSSTVNALAGLFAKKPGAGRTTTTTTSRPENETTDQLSDGSTENSSSTTNALAGLLNKRPGAGRTTTTTTSRPESETTDQSSDGSTDNSSSTTNGLAGLLARRPSVRTTTTTTTARSTLSGNPTSGPESQREAKSINPGRSPLNRFRVASSSTTERIPTDSSETPSSGVTTRLPRYGSSRFKCISLNFFFQT